MSDSSDSTPPYTVRPVTTPPYRDEYDRLQQEIEQITDQITDCWRDEQAIQSDVAEPNPWSRFQCDPSEYVNAVRGIGRQLKDLQDRRTVLGHHLRELQDRQADLRRERDLRRWNRGGPTKKHAKREREESKGKFNRRRFHAPGPFDPNQRLYNVQADPRMELQRLNRLRRSIVAQLDALDAAVGSGDETPAYYEEKRRLENAHQDVVDQMADLQQAMDRLTGHAAGKFNAPGHFGMDPRLYNAHGDPTVFDPVQGRVVPLDLNAPSRINPDARHLALQLYDSLMAQIGTTIVPADIVKHLHPVKQYNFERAWESVTAPDFPQKLASLPTDIWANMLWHVLHDVNDAQESMGKPPLFDSGVLRRLGAGLRNTSGGSNPLPTFQNIQQMRITGPVNNPERMDPESTLADVQKRNFHASGRYNKRRRKFHAPGQFGPHNAPDNVHLNATTTLNARENRFRDICHAIYDQLRQLPPEAMRALYPPFRDRLIQFLQLPPRQVFEDNGVAIGRQTIFSNPQLHDMIYSLARRVADDIGEVAPSIESALRSLIEDAQDVSRDVDHLINWAEGEQQHDWSIGFPRPAESAGPYARPSREELRRRQQERRQNR
jgi:hypothetical protein